MAVDESWLLNKSDTCNISKNVKKHIRHGRHRTKYTFDDDPDDTLNSNIEVYIGTDHIKLLHEYVEEKELGKIEFNVFRCQSKSKIPAHYANITLGNVSVASSFPEKYSVPEVAKQVAARKALNVLKKNYSYLNIPTTEDDAVIVDRLEKELQKNYGLFCDKIECIYKDIYKESLPSDWLSRINQLTTNIFIDHLPDKSILYYDPSNSKKKCDEFVDSSTAEAYSNLPLMTFLDTTERTVTVTSVDSNHTFWIRFVQDKINDDYNTLYKLMNTPDENKNFSKMFSIEVNDVYAVVINEEWHRFQACKIENDIVTGVLIDFGIEFIVDKSNIMFLPQKFLDVPSQAIKCALSSLFFAPYFEIAKQIFDQMLFNKEFTVVPDNIDGDIPLVTLYNGKCNINNLIMDAMVEESSFNKIDKVCEKCNLSYIGDGYVYLHPPNDTLFIMESILDTISCSRPLEQLYSKKSISPHKLYLVKCIELDMWSRAIIDDYIFTERKFKVFFVDYGNYGVIDQDKFIDLQSIDALLAVIPYQALKVSVHLFPPEELNESRSRALNEMINDRPLDIEVIRTNSDGIQVVEIYDGNDPSENRISYNAQLYQSV